MTPHYGLYFGCEQRSCCQIVLEMWKKIHMLICNHWVTTKRASTVSMHFLDPKIPVLGGMQKQASKLCILTWYGSNYGQFWIFQTEANVQFFKLKLMTKIEFNFSNFFQLSILIILCRKNSNETFCSFSTLFLPKIPCWNFRAILWSEKSIEK